MTKVAAEAKVGKEAETKEAPTTECVLSWIPAVPAGTASKKKMI